MSDIEATMASGSPADAAASAGSPPAGQSGEGVQPDPAGTTVAAASGGVTPADEFADLEAALEGDPRKESFLARLREVSERGRQFQQQLGQYEAYRDWLDPIARLSELGANPAMLAQHLQQLGTGAAPAEQSPQDAFHDWLREERQVDPFDLDDTQYEALQLVWELREERRAAQEAQQQVEQEQLRHQLTTEMTQALEKFPALKGPDDYWARQVYAMVGVSGGRQTVLQAAEELNKRIESHVQQRLATYAAGKAQDAQVPVAAGGSSPSPVVRPDFHRLGSQDQQRVMEDYLRAATVPM